MKRKSPEHTVRTHISAPILRCSECFAVLNNLGKCVRSDASCRWHTMFANPPKIDKETDVYPIEAKDAFPVAEQVKFETFLCKCNRFTGNYRAINKHGDYIGDNKDGNVPKIGEYCSYHNVLRVLNHPNFQVPLRCEYSVYDTELIEKAKNTPGAKQIGGYFDNRVMTRYVTFVVPSPVGELRRQKECMDMVESFDGRKLNITDFRNEMELVLCLWQIGFINDEAAKYIQETILDNVAYLHCLLNKFDW